MYTCVSDIAFFFVFKMPRYLIVFALTILAIIDGEVNSYPTKKSSYLWRINSTLPSYLFGTIHIPYTVVWDSVSENVKTAFNSSRQVYFEIDDERPDKSCAMLPPGQKLTQVRVQRNVMTTINGIRDHP